MSGTDGGPGSVPEGIFKAYDVRGLYGDEMDGDTAFMLGRAFARVLAELRDKPVADLSVGLGRDMRLQAPEMAGRLREGLLAEGVHVLDAGMVGTEMLYFMVGARELDGGAMVTASHNPKAYTGVKLVREGALALSGETGITRIRDLILAGLDAPPGGGESEEVDIAPEFNERALSFIDTDSLKPMKVVRRRRQRDGGPDGRPAARPVRPRPRGDVLDPDGNFPDHEPNPLLPENRQFIVDRVLSERAGLGIAWDGDADRCFFIDDEGEFVDGDFLTALLAELVLEKEPGADILYDVRASRAVPDTVEAAGGTAHMGRVGHAFMKQAMKEIGGAFAGEVSGHYYFRQFYNADKRHDPGPARPGAALEVGTQPLRPRRRPAIQVLHQRRDQLRGGRPGGEDERDRRGHSDAEVSWLDGVSVDYEDWHFNVRPSNTEPLLRLNLESLLSREDMESKRDEVLALIRASTASSSGVRAA